MSDDKLPTILVQWEGNQSKRYDKTKEEIWLANIVAINETAVIDPSADEVHINDRIEYEFVQKKGKVQLWRGVVVSTDPDADRRARSETTAGSASRATAKTGQCSSSGSKKPERTATKGAARPNASRADTERRAAKSLFEGAAAGSRKGKRQKRPSSSPLPLVEPKRKRGKHYFCGLHVFDIWGKI